MPKPIVTGTKSYPGEGIYEFSFRWEGKEYKVEPIPGTPDIIEMFHRYVRMAEKKGVNPFTYKHLDKILINGKKPRQPKEKQEEVEKSEIPPEGEQMELELKVAEMIDSVADQLEAKGHLKEAEDLDVIANSIDQGALQDVRSTSFFDEIANKDIPADDAMKILDAYDDGADSEHSIAKSTGIDANTCDTVMQVAHEHGLTKLIKSGKWAAWKRSRPRA